MIWNGFLHFKRGIQYVFCADLMFFYDEVFFMTENVLQEATWLIFLINKVQLMFIYLFFSLRISITIVATIDLKIVHENYEQVKVTIRNIVNGLNKFWQHVSVSIQTLTRKLRQAKTIWWFTRYRKLLLRHIT